ncbi:hypothetical protein Q9L42_002775 [Methylomarinum sp. Ch1-1]|uniref:Transmembrane anchor protein n=1 Tax=Methylomarinum roseum TaxID=3067653 RepID=A0AAU7NVN1_9GAMM|nr:hypothetical protein [Methylomarinum sp. Ch1-1]MDP4522908.1 hypothetical protein [Methylomarinum sp. Ch1-1]
MNDSNPPIQSLRSLFIASGVATLIAGFVLTVFVLPAEYGIDPTGIGKKMGLTVLAKQTTAPEPVQAMAISLQPQQTAEITCPEPSDSEQNSVKTSQNSASAAAPQWQDTVKIIVPAKQGLEYKFHLKKGASLEYSWATDGAKLYFDFHGEPKGDKTGYFKSFKVSTDQQSSGALTAPFEGSHGWYWENNTRSPITVILNTKGTYRILGLM